MNDEALVERIARIIDPSSWAVMDSYLAETKRKYRGQNVGWPADQFHHKESMAKARAVLAAVIPQIEARVVAEIVAWLRAAKPAYISTYGLADDGAPDFVKLCWYLAGQIERGGYKESQP